MDDYNILSGHAYLGSPLGGLHTYQLTLFSGTAYDTSWWHYLHKNTHISKYLYRSYDRLCTSLLLRNKISSQKKKKKKRISCEVPSQLERPESWGPGWGRDQAGIARVSKEWEQTQVGTPGEAVGDSRKPMVLKGSRALPYMREDVQHGQTGMAAQAVSDDTTKSCRCMWMTSGDHVDGFWDHVTSGINV
jgi:hypothetical protein